MAEPSSLPTEAEKDLDGLTKYRGLGGTVVLVVVVVVDEVEEGVVNTVNVGDG